MTDLTLVPMDELCKEISRRLDNCAIIGSVSQTKDVDKFVVHCSYKHHVLMIGMLEEFKLNLYKEVIDDAA